MTSGSLWNCYTDEVNDDANENNADNYRTKNNKRKTSTYFNNRTNIIWSTPEDNNTIETEVVVPLKYLSNFWRCLDLPLINCEIELDLSWWEDCI